MNLGYSDPRFLQRTNTMDMPAHRELTIIVAATNAMGIGRCGALPWPSLKKEMAYFARVTKRSVPSSVSSCSYPQLASFLDLHELIIDVMPAARSRPNQ